MQLNEVTCCKVERVMHLEVTFLTIFVTNIKQILANNYIIYGIRHHSLAAATIIKFIPEKETEFANFNQYILININCQAYVIKVHPVYQTN